MISIDLLCRPQTKSTKKPTKPLTQKPSECYIKILRLMSDLHKCYGNALEKFLCGLVCLVRKGSHGQGDIVLMYTVPLQQQAQRNIQQLV